MRAITNVQVVTPSGIIHEGTVIYDQQIRWVGPFQENTVASFDELLDGRGLFLGTGLIDIHIHGIAGADTSDATVASLMTMSSTLARQGVTSFLPTTITAPWPEVRRVLGAIRHAQRGAPSGASVLGAHLEGPFLSPERVGAHSQAELLAPDFSLLREFLDVIRIVTFAPELAGGGSFLNEAALFPDLVMSIGHSNATFTETQAAIWSGIRHATHLFNALPPLLHREPGVVGAVLAERIHAELIADNVHVHPGLYKVLLRALGDDKLVLVSDAMRGAGLGDGEFLLGGQLVKVRDGSARLAGGQLAGSVITLNKAVQNFRIHSGLELSDALNLASRNPARLLGLKNKGALNVGNDADLILFDDELNIHATIVGGRTVFQT